MAKNKEKRQSTPSKQQSSFCSCSRIVFIFLAIFVGVISYTAYQWLTPPNLPSMDLDYMWKQYPDGATQDQSIRPFRVEFSDVVINDLRERLLHRRPFVPPLKNVGFQYGFNTDFLTKVLDFWQNNYNFKEQEQFLNIYNHYITNIQGLDIHYVHVRPKMSGDIKVVPILLLHGWPSSIRDFYELIPLLTSPKLGYDFAFEVIVPSLPGFGFSQASEYPGLGLAETAVIMRNLMQRIGHKTFYVHGGDLGHDVASNMATLFPDQVLGFHTNMPFTLHPLGALYTLVGTLFPSLIADPGLENRMYPLRDKLATILEESGYFHIQSTKPDTVGIALTDSPAGLVSYILEKYSTWTNPQYTQAYDGNLLSKYSLTSLLDNVMIYWVTNSITTSLRMYAETMNKKQFGLKLEEIPTNVPTWGIKFKHELLHQPDSVLQLKYKNYIHSTIVEDGGHFAAFEQPKIMADDIYKAVFTFVQYHKSNVLPDVNSKNNINTIYDFTVNDIRGNPIKLNKYKGNVLIIVNVASQCGLTDKNYRQLNELYDKYERKGLRILAFPCNQFNGQEPGDANEIIKFTKNLGVKFHIFEKIDVNGEKTHPLWKFLKQKLSGSLGDFIKWNFSKFIVDKNGIPVERFGSNIDPIDMEPYLAKYF